MPEKRDRVTVLMEGVGTDDIEKGSTSSIIVLVVLCVTALVLFVAVVFVGRGNNARFAKIDYDSDDDEVIDEEARAANAANDNAEEEEISSISSSDRRGREDSSSFLDSHET